MTDKVEDYTQDPISQEPQGRKPIAENLPKSSDEKFWTPDAERTRIEIDKLQKPNMSEHYLEWRGPHAVCTKCPFQHTIPLDFRQYDLINGQPVKKPLTTTKKDITIK